MDQNGFAGTHISGEQEKPFVFKNAVLERGQGFFMFLTEPEEFGVRRNLKRLVFQIVKGLVHNKSASTARFDSNKSGNRNAVIFNEALK